MTKTKGLRKTNTVGSRPGLAKPSIQETLVKNSVSDKPVKKVHEEKEVKGDEIKDLKEAVQKNGKEKDTSKVLGNDKQKKTILAVKLEQEDQTTSKPKPLTITTNATTTFTSTPVLTFTKRKNGLSDDTLKIKRKLSFEQQQKVSNNTPLTPDELSPTSPTADANLRRGTKRIRSSSLNFADPPIESSPVILLFEFVNRLPSDPRRLSREELLRAGTWMFDTLLTKSFSRPFVNPVSEDALLYRSVISRLMDLTTAEKRLWAGKYKDLKNLYTDVAQILSNAFTFHNEGEIYEEARQMCDYFVKQLYPQLTKLVFGDDSLRMNELMPLPHEEIFTIPTFSFENLKSSKSIYVVPTMNYKRMQTNPQAIKKSIPSEVLDRLLNFNHGVLEYFKDGTKPSTPKLNVSSTTRDYLRIYITKGVTMMTECIDNPNSIVVIMGNMKFIRKEKRFRFDALFARPFGKTHDLDTFEFPDLNDAKGWVRCAILARRDNIELSMATHWFANKLLPFSTTKFDESTLTPEFHEAYIESLWRDKPNIKVDPSMKFYPKDHEDSFIKSKDHEDSFIKSKDHGDSFVKSKDLEDSFVKLKDHKDLSIKSKDHKDLSIKSKDHEEPLLKSKHHGESLTKLKHHGESFAKLKHHEESFAKLKHHEESFAKLKHHEESFAKLKHHEESSAKLKHYGGSHVKSKGHERTHVKSSKYQGASEIDVFSTGQPSPPEQIASSNHKSVSEKVITVEQVISLEKISSVKPKIIHDDLNDEPNIQIKQEPNDDVVVNDEKEKMALPKKTKRPRRSNRETYAYLNMLPKRRTRQQSQSEWNLPHDLLPQITRQSPQPKRRKSGKPIERENPVITKSTEPEVTQPQNQVTSIVSHVSHKRGPYKPRKIGIKNATIRRSARQANRKERTVTSNDSEKGSIKREKVYIKQEFEDGQNLMVIEERAVNECPMEVVQLVDQESDGQEIPLFLAEEVESFNENNDLETPNQQSAPEPKGIWYNIKNGKFPLYLSFSIIKF
ncbi:4907_t:CDS:2 [Cetraspora pellucida]|uniref:4907_t:CDS:1 n=1 Tax=Cetraspora pellucida TaxID=1433469 RepID=A0ACA9KNT2_9GLOM|nr:4907_t:CDS:2 [Cetraspora pellucida]